MDEKYKELVSKKLKQIADGYLHVALLRIKNFAARAPRKSDLGVSIGHAQVGCSSAAHPRASIQRPASSIHWAASSIQHPAPTI